MKWSKIQKNDVEEWVSYNQINLKIELIDRFEGGNQELRVYFTDTEKKKWVLYFDFIWDFRYSVENGFLNRNYSRQTISSVYTVENSKYIEYFEDQVCGTYSTMDFRHFIILDQIDTGLEILATKDPVLYSDDKS